jgi:phosphoglycolate phosphatase
MPHELTPIRDLDCIVFDLDGTLVDSRLDIATALDLALVERRLPALGPERVAGFVGDGVRMLVERSLTALEASHTMIDGVVTSFMDAYQRILLETTQTYPGVRETLDEARDRSIALAVVTNKPYSFSMAILEGLEIDRYFDILVGGDSLPVRKPDPSTILHALAACEALPANSVVVGDGEPDILAAKAAGTLAVGVTFGFRSRERLSEVGADVLLDSMAELFPALAKLGLGNERAAQ